MNPKTPDKIAKVEFDNIVTCERTIPLSTRLDRSFDFTPFSARKILRVYSINVVL